MIGVIADDLTGAAEIGAVGWRHGLSAEIVRLGQPIGAVDLVCVDTDSRLCPPEEAAKRARLAARQLQAAGVDWLYKKIDSVLRGQVMAEVEAVMQELAVARALLLPANPTLGRTIRGGNYFLRGRPLHRTEFALDPHFPRTTSKVLQLVDPPKLFALQALNGKRSLAAGVIGIGDVGRRLDLQRWSKECHAPMLPAGGAEFFNALIETRCGLKSPAQPKAAGKCATPELFVIGTSTPSAKAFVALARQKKTPVFSLPQELAWGVEFSEAARSALTQRAVAALASHSRVILRVGLPPVRHAEAARGLSDQVVRIAGQVLQKVRVGSVFAEGGATAAALVRTMGWKRMMVLREEAPGVATLALEGANQLTLTIKPGTYVWPEQWT